MGDIKPRRLKAFLCDKGYKIPDFLIVYIEDYVLKQDPSSEGVAVPGQLDAWDDLRVVLWRDKMPICAKATTEPGRYYTENPMNPGGAFRIALNEMFMDSWALGLHNWNPAHPSLVQVGDIKGHRDANQDGLRTGDEIVVGDDFGVNQHGTMGQDPDKIGRWSAGCLVGQYWSTHLKFIEVCKGVNLKYYPTIVISGDDYAKYDG